MYGCTHRLMERLYTAGRGNDGRFATAKATSTFPPPHQPWAAPAGNVAPDEQSLSPKIKAGHSWATRMGEFLSEREHNLQAERGNQFVADQNRCGDASTAPSMSEP